MSVWDVGTEVTHEEEGFFSHDKWPSENENSEAQK